MKGEAMDEIKIVYFSNGMVIIGKPEYEVGEDVCGDSYAEILKIISPRAIMMMQDANGRTGTQMIELFGKPDAIDILETPLFIGEVKDKDMWKKYIEFTTTLHLAH